MLILVVSKETARLESSDLHLSYKGITTGCFSHRPTAVAYAQLHENLRKKAETMFRLGKGNILEACEGPYDIFIA
jgi:hypothetical protein